MAKKKTKGEKLAEAFLENRKMDHLRSYRERGRVFETLTDQELETRWVEVQLAVLGQDDQARLHESNDLSAEYFLRGKEEPVHLVRPALKKAVERIKGFTEKDFQPTVERLDAFIAEMAKPKN